MQRCHLYLPLTDSSGAAYPYAEVTLLGEDGQPLTQPVYLDPVGGSPQQWPVLATPAVVDLWIDTPARVTVQALLPEGVVFTRAGVDVLPAPRDTARTTGPLHIAATGQVDGTAMLAISPGGSASWQVLDVLHHHRHEGDAPGSTSLGQGDLVDIYPRQTWVGANIAPAQGDQGPDAVAVGDGAAPLGGRSVAVGKGAAAAASGVAVGGGTAVGSGSVGVGKGAAAGHEKVALGRAANASSGPSGAVLVGPDAATLPGEEIRLSDAAVLREDGTVVIGQGAVPDLTAYPEESFTVLLGTVIAPYYLGVRGDAVLADASSTVGFYGQAGAVRPSIAASSIPVGAPGREALVSLLGALAQLGLITLT